MSTGFFRGLADQALHTAPRLRPALAPFSVQHPEPDYALDEVPTEDRVDRQRNAPSSPSAQRRQSVVGASPASTLTAAEPQDNPAAQPQSTPQSPFVERNFTPPSPQELRVDDTPHAAPIRTHASPLLPSADATNVVTATPPPAGAHPAPPASPPRRGSRTQPRPQQRIATPPRSISAAVVAPPTRNASMRHEQQAATAPSPEVHIHIGRIELTAAAPAVAGKREAAATKKPMSLDEYLQKRRQKS